MDSMGKPSDYHLFLLRVWSDTPRGGVPPAVRCSLESAATRNRRGFESVEGLACYLGQLATDLARRQGEERACRDPLPLSPGEEVAP
jgi:hypothetical protein